MFKLPVTTNSRDERPTIISEELEDIANLHSSDIIGQSIENQKPYNYMFILPRLDNNATPVLSALRWIIRPK